MTQPIVSALDSMMHSRPANMPLNDPRAVGRVRDVVPCPRVCPHCCCKVDLVNNSGVYGRSYGDWPWLYLCSNRACGAYVGTHPQTDLPLGTLATARTREARKRAKALFNALWEAGPLTRAEAYSRLAAEMGVDVSVCHFGWFDVEQCRRASEASRRLHASLRA